MQRVHPKVILLGAQEVAPFRQFPATIVTPNYQETFLFVEDIKEWIFDASGVPGPENLLHVEQIAQYMRSSLAAEYIAITLEQHGVFLLDHHGNARSSPCRCP